MAKARENKGRSRSRTDARLEGRTPMGPVIGWAHLPWMVFALVSLLAFVSMFNMIELGDEGVICTGAWRITLGEVPYRDFFELIPPVTFYLVALFYKLLGPSIIAGRLVTFLTAIGLALLTIRASRNLKMPPLFGSLALSAFLVAGVSSWPFPSHHWTANLALTGSLVCLFEAIDLTSLKLSVISGILAGLTALSLQDQGGYWIIGVALLSLPFLPSGERRKLAIAWICGAALTVAIAGALLLSAVSFKTLWHDLVVWPATRYKAQGGNRSELAKVFGPILDIWRSGKGEEFPLAFAFNAISNLVLFFAIPGSIAILLWGMYKRAGDRAKLGALLAACLAFGGTALHRLSQLNTHWAAALPLLVLAWGLHAWASSGKRRWIPYAATVALLAINLWIGALLTYKIITIPSLKVLTPAGILRTTKESNARPIQELVDAIGKHVPAGDPIFCGGYIAMIYFITQHPNPTPYDVLILYNTDQQVQDAIRHLEVARPWLVIRQIDLPGNRMLDYMDSNYSVVWSNSTFLLCERKDPHPESLK